MRTLGKIAESWLFGGVLLAASFVFVSAQGTSEKPKTESTTAASTTAARYVGSAACKACHPKVVEPWVSSPHGKALSQDSLAAEIKGCEACHGPASVHIGSGAQNKPRVPKADDAAATNATCGACHFQSESSKAPKEFQNLSESNFIRSAHGRKKVSCVSCHAGHPNGNDKQLLKPGTDVCLTCHGKLLESAPGKKAAYTHSPVAQGKCLTCHDPHGSSNRNMVVSDIQKVCQSCHNVSDPKIVTAHEGYPIDGGKCTSCHDPHSHDNKAGLLREKKHMPFKSGKCETCHTKPAAGQPIGFVKPAQELCFSCHPASALMKDGEKAHVPVKAGLCVSCHNPHVSSEKALLKGNVSNLCFTCHSKVESATVAEHRHKVLENSDCMLCHKPHSSKQEKLLVKDQTSLCGQCHKHSFSHPVDKKADGTVIKDPSTGGNLVCASCHDIHGGKFKALTKGDKGRDLCVRCHSGTGH